MLQLKKIVKNYAAGDLKVEALKGVDLAFRESEFVSILGPSGCGKTTLLNIIGGLDVYSSGDLIINNRSTKEFKSSDWDTYRNHSVGFVFQSYNLIPHQTVLSNVELALTLSGVSKSERRKRAAEALKQVGLGDQLHKKPNQMSGGQMQRVAIARALVNDPDILLADEPTGALDTETSVQIMNLLKEISKDRLIIMVTHNPELAELYSTRIVKLIDGNVIDDSNPYTEEEIKKDNAGERKSGKKGKKSMSFFTALSLSFNNLMTKRGRTILTSFAGSIGIIGISLILALSTGVQTYINDVQRDTLSSYPVTIEKEESALASMLSTMSSSDDIKDELRSEHEADAVYSNAKMYTMFNMVFAQEKSQNNLTELKKYLDEQMNEETSTTNLYQYASSIQYEYDIDMNCYVKNQDGEYISCDITSIFAPSSDSSESALGGMYSMMSENMSEISLWDELMTNKDGTGLSDTVTDSYQLVYGQWPEEANEIVLILDKNNEISDLAFYSLGLIPQEEIMDIMASAMNQTEISTEQRKLSYEEVCDISFKLLLNSDYYADKDGNGIWEYVGDDSSVMDMVIKNAFELNIVGVVKANDDTVMASVSPVFGYTSKLTEYVINATNESEIVKQQTAVENENYDVFTGRPFVILNEEELTEQQKADKISDYFASLTDKEKTELYTEIISTPSDEYIEETLAAYMSEYDTREKMEQLAANAYEMDIETIKSYLDSYTDEEIFDMMKKQMTKVIESTYAAKAQEQVEAIMNTPSEEEMSALIGRITSQLPTAQEKIGYVYQSWKENTTMSDEAIMGYLMGLSEQQLEQAVVSVASKDAQKMYSELASADSESRYTKVAAVFDLQYGSETDTTVLAGYYDEYMPSSASKTTLSENLETLGVMNMDSPTSINIYASSFENKDAISKIITEYNENATEENKIEYTDYVALLMSGITDIINAISYGLIAFVAISLVVSSIMIGIITYISVLERTKEIGILRAIGASKHDVSLVFNAETLIVGLLAGLIGIGCALLLCIPINLIIHSLTGIMNINAYLLPAHCITLVLLSVMLTVIAGLIPASVAAKKDPVEALRTE